MNSNREDVVGKVIEALAAAERGLPVGRTEFEETRYDLSDIRFGLGLIGVSIWLGVAALLPAASAVQAYLFSSSIFLLCLGAFELDAPGQITRSTRRWMPTFSRWAGVSPQDIAAARRGK
jgi:hypothetical protein